MTRSQHDAQDNTGQHADYRLTSMRDSSLALWPSRDIKATALILDVAQIEAGEPNHTHYWLVSSYLVQMLQRQDDFANIDPHLVLRKPLPLVEMGE